MLKTKISLMPSSNALTTKRSYKQSYFLLLSTMLGSVFGMMNAVGGLMRVFEGNWIAVKESIGKRDKIKRLIYSSEKFIDIMQLDFKSKTENVDTTNVYNYQTIGYTNNTD